LQIAIIAASADSAMNTFVSAAFFKTPDNIVSINGSTSFVGMFSTIDLIVNREFLAS
jgi:hypothetical protein